MFRFLLAIMIGLVFVSSAFQPARSAEPYDIDVILSLTGPGAFLGNAQAKSMKAIESLVNRGGGINGRPIHFVIQDDQTTPQLAVQITNRLLARHVSIMLGPDIGASCFAVMPIVKNGPVQYCFAPTIHPKAPSYTFSAGVSTKDLALAGLRWLHARGIDKIGLLASTDASGQDGETVTRENVALPELKGMKIVATEHFGTTDINVDAQLLRLKAAGAQLIYVQATGTPFGTVLKDINDTALDLPVLTHSGNINYVQMAQYANFLPKELYFTGLRYEAYAKNGTGAVNDANRQFIAALTAVGVPRPDVTHMLAWDATMISIAALRHLGVNATPAQLRAYIANLHGYAGINGIMDFRDGQQRGLKENGALVVRWDSNKDDFVPVSKPGGYLLSSRK
jgi:branched-chain amino acid transport system substrate-binding protein